jgi:hypothetical protein
MIRDAAISPDGKYRWWLTREWDFRRPRLAWVMLNPSTADAKYDDPTIRKCIGFSNQFGYGSLAVVNLFAYRTNSPKVLASEGFLVGAENDHWIKLICNQSSRVVVAWGASNYAKGAVGARCRHVIDELLKDIGVYALRTTKDGMPWHPLMLPYSCKMELWEPPW